jgi:hypothetical protein
VELRLVDAVGRIYSLSRSEDLGKFSPGLYLLIAEKDTRRITRKVIIR